MYNHKDLLSTTTHERVVKYIHQLSDDYELEYETTPAFAVHYFVMFYSSIEQRSNNDQCKREVQITASTCLKIAALLHEKTVLTDLLDFHSANNITKAEYIECFNNIINVLVPELMVITSQLSEKQLKEIIRKSDLVRYFENDGDLQSIAMEGILMGGSIPSIEDDLLVVNHFMSTLHVKNDRDLQSIVAMEEGMRASIPSIKDNLLVALPNHFMSTLHDVIPDDTISEIVKERATFFMTMSLYDLQFFYFTSKTIACASILLAFCFNDESDLFSSNIERLSIECEETKVWLFVCVHQLRGFYDCCFGTTIDIPCIEECEKLEALETPVGA